MKAAQYPFFPNYPGIGFSIAGGGHEVFKFIEIIDPANLLFISPLFELLPEQDLVEGLMLRVDVVRGIEDLLVAIAVEVIGGDDVKDALGTSQSINNAPRTLFSASVLCGSSRSLTSPPVNHKYVCR